MSITINGSGSITGVSSVESIPASDVDFTPSGNISATTVQAALAEIAGNSGAAKIGYQPAGTGAVATTVWEKLLETVSITDKGDSLATAFSDLGGAEGTGYGANPVVLDLAGKTITFTGTLYVPTNVSIVNGTISSATGRLVWRNPYLANTALRGYTEYWSYMTSRNRDVVFSCIVVINVYIGAKFNNCDFNGLVFVNSNSLWTEYNSFGRCSFAQNTAIGAAIRMDGNSSGTSPYSTGSGAGTADGSFGYNNFESNCKIDSTAPQVGIAVVSGGTLYNAHLGFQGYARGAGPSGAFLYLDASSVNHCVFEVHLESFGAAANVLSISNGSNFWYNIGSIQSASPEMVMAQGGTADIRSNDISVVGVALLDSGGNSVFNGSGYMTKIVTHVAKRQWAYPAFAAYTTSDQAFNSNTDTIISLGTEEYDTNSNFASSRFTPTVAGYYQINAQARYTATATVASAILHIYKNGAAYRSSVDTQGLATTMVRSISTIVYMNGSTDYLEMISYVFDNGAQPVIKGGAANTFFNGCLIVPA